ncbi:paraquat-inducible protein A [Vibrio chagasii]|nr:paraquat-inducible protein A [Vibrio chagasii]
MGEGFPLLGLLIPFCSSIAPLLVCGSVLLAIFHLLALLRRSATSLAIIQTLKHWMMLDVFFSERGDPPVLSFKTTLTFFCWSRFKLA